MNFIAALTALLCMLPVLATGNDYGLLTNDLSSQYAENFTESFYSCMLPNDTTVSILRPAVLYEPYTEQTLVARILKPIFYIAEKVSEHLFNSRISQELSTFYLDSTSYISKIINDYLEANTITLHYSSNFGVKMWISIVPKAVPTEEQSQEQTQSNGQSHEQSQDQSDGQSHEHSHNNSGQSHQFDNYSSVRNAEADKDEEDDEDDEEKSFFWPKFLLSLYGLFSLLLKYHRRIVFPAARNLKLCDPFACKNDNSVAITFDTPEKSSGFDRKQEVRTGRAIAVYQEVERNKQTMKIKAIAVMRKWEPKSKADILTARVPKLLSFRIVVQGMMPEEFLKSSQLNMTQIRIFDHRSYLGAMHFNCCLFLPGCENLKNILFYWNGKVKIGYSTENFVKKVSWIKGATYWDASRAKHENRHRIYLCRQEYLQLVKAFVPEMYSYWARKYSDTNPGTDSEVEYKSRCEDVPKPCATRTKRNRLRAFFGREPKSSNCETD